MNNYRIISDIGSGAYSTVHKAIDVNTGHIVAIKKITDQNLTIKHIINRQVKFLHQCINHPNIIQLYKCFSIANFTYLVFEYMPMDLISFYKSIQESKNRNLTQEEICYISFQLCTALKFLHQKQIMHRDIKPENILIDPETLNIKLIDFGFAKYSNEEKNTNYMVTRWYRPIQIVLSLPYSEKADVFATGALILQLFLGHQIFRSSSNLDQLHWIIRICGFPYSWKLACDQITKLKIQIEDNPPQLKTLMKEIRPLAADLIYKLLKSCPQERITTIQACNHPYFSRYRINNQSISDKQKYFINRVHGKISKNQSEKVLPLVKNVRAYSIQLPTVQNHLSFRQNSNYIVGKNQLAQLINHKQANDNKINQKAEEVNQISKFQIQKQQHIRKNKQYSAALEYGIGSNQKEKNGTKNVEDKQKNTVRGRVRSLNQHGINVVSLKKLKINREIHNEKSRQKEDQYRQTSTALIKLKSKKEKQKPMFLRVKDKINQGRLNERGSEQSQKQDSSSTKYLGFKNKKVSSHQENVKSEALQLKKWQEYKPYAFPID